MFWKLNVNIRLPDDLVTWKHLPPAIRYRDTNDQRKREREREGERERGRGREREGERERERERERETKKWPANLGQKIALAQSKLGILQSIARKKKVEESSTIKWAKIPKSLLTLFFFFMWQASLFFSPNSYFSDHPYVEGLNVIDNPKCHKVLM